VEAGFLGVYWIEAILRTVSDGLTKAKNCTVVAYLRDQMNLFDLAILIFGTLEFLLWYHDLDIGVGIGGLRCLRVLRIAKLIKALPTLRMITSTIAAAMPSIVELLFFGWMVILFFMIYGVHLYTGVLNRACYFTGDVNGTMYGTQVEIRPCSPTVKFGAHTCMANQTCYTEATLPAEFDHIVPVFNGTISFDHAGVAFYAVFVALSMEGWTKLLTALDDAVGASANWVFFVGIVLFGGYILVNMIIGSLAGFYIKTATFQQHETKRSKRRNSVAQAQSKERRMTGGTLTVQLRKFSTLDETSYAQQMAERANDEDAIKEHDDMLNENRSNMFPRLKRFVESKWTVRLLLTVIFANAIVLSLDHYPQQDTWLEMLDRCNYGFVGVFAIELILKLLTYGFKGYFQGGFMNVFDSIITLSSIAELIVVTQTDDSLSISAFRSIRLVRVLRLFGGGNQLESYGKAFTKALQQLGSLVLLIVLYLIICSLLGMQFFGGKFWSRRNYDRFDNAMLSNFMILTCSDWNQIMYEGIEALGGANGVSALPGVFFIAIVTFGHYILFGTPRIAVRMHVKSFHTVQGDRHTALVHTVLILHMTLYHALEFLGVLTRCFPKCWLVFYLRQALFWPLHSRV
jgi:hypothetical protein